MGRNVVKAPVVSTGLLAAVFFGYHAQRGRPGAVRTAGDTSFLSELSEYCSGDAEFLGV